MTKAETYYKIDKLIIGYQKRKLSTIQEHTPIIESHISDASLMESLLNEIDIFDEIISDLEGLKND